MLSGYGKEAQLPRGMWNFPRSGIKLMSPALAGRFFTTGPPEVSEHEHYKLERRGRILGFLSWDDDAEVASGICL